MKRRNFLKNGLVASSLAWPGVSHLEAAPKPLDAKPKRNNFKHKYAPHLSMFKHHVGDDPIKELQFMADVGFMALEDNGLMDRTPELQTKIGETLAKLGMTMGVFVVRFDKWPPQSTLTSGKAEWRETFLKTCRQAVETAKRVNAKWMTVVPGNFDRSIPMGFQTANVVESLRRAVEIVEPHGLVMVLEPLSDNPDLFLRHCDQTYLICKAVNSPSCKILYDIYHMQRNEGHLIPSIDRAWDEIAYIQIGDNPGRNEPTTGEINYKNIFEHLYKKGYRGVLGMEHGLSKPGKEGELALIQAYANSDSF